MTYEDVNAIRDSLNFSGQSAANDNDFFRDDNGSLMVKFFNAA